MSNCIFRTVFQRIQKTNMTVVTPSIVTKLSFEVACKMSSWKRDCKNMFLHFRLELLVIDDVECR